LKSYIFFLFIIFNFKLLLFSSFFSSTLLLPTSLLHSVLILTHLALYCPTPSSTTNFFFLFSFHHALSFSSSSSSPPSPSTPTTLTFSISTTHWILYYTKFKYYPVFPIPQQALTITPSSTMTELHLNTH
jgi:hypothetical protein